ncbi:hypothetical protein LIN78_05730 [Leeia sp. TBRC 13508]|uniref:Uncharacterized protein n=1 Tax=Leeia speluncae TaxID=2884804 RepID=A0ABS8D4E1_9NEIS|nr:hypothetical protein [Leeia speluncae]MCB6183047.1 hypothetical protein [Leeia speluncae]
MQVSNTPTTKGNPLDKQLFLSLGFSEEETAILINSELKKRQPAGRALAKPSKAKGKSA